LHEVALVPAFDANDDQQATVELDDENGRHLYRVGSINVPVTKEGRFGDPLASRFARRIGYLPS